MAVIADRSIVLVVVILCFIVFGFSQVASSQLLSRTLDVIGPRKLADDSAAKYQSTSSHSLAAAAAAAPSHPGRWFNSITGSEDYEEIPTSVRDAFSPMKDDNNEEINDSDEAYHRKHHGYDLDDDEEDEYGMHTCETDVPLKRSRRRIIPVGKAIDRGRGDSSPYERSRSPWAQPPNRGRQPVAERSGPTGSAALFSLYPELAPADWKERSKSSGLESKTKEAKKKKKKSNPKERDTEANEAKSPQPAREEKSQNDEGSRSVTPDKVQQTSSGSAATASSTRKKSKKSHRRSKLPKKMKEEIAVFAEQHGIEKAITHFKTKMDSPLKAGSVEKFLRRYKKRLERKASRS